MIRVCVAAKPSRNGIVLRLSPSLAESRIACRGLSTCAVPWPCALLPFHL